VCAGPKPEDASRHLACAPGQVGYLNQTRTYACTAGGWAAADWAFESNHCTAPPEGDPTCTVDPGSNTIVMNNISWQRCLKRSDTNAITYTKGEASTTISGAPTADFDMLAYDAVDPTGDCSKLARVAHCTVPVAAKPQCFVSPWDGSVQVTGLGTELMCAKRDDNGQLALSDRGRLSFSGPADAATTVSLFRQVGQDGACANAAGQQACPAVPRPAPMCTVQPDGSMLIQGLNESTPCVVRNDTSEQQLTVNGQARFTASPLAPETRFVLFNNINSYGACTGPVSAVSCQAAE
jgi:hypothetical protein